MAARGTVLRLNGSNEFQVMSSTDISNIQAQAIYQYSLNPSVTLSVVANNGNLNRMIDRRYQAGAASVNNSGFVDSPDVGAIDTVWDQIDQAVASPANTWDNSNVNIAYPVYLNASNEIQAMSRTDFYDTFIAPAISLWYSPVGSGNFSGAAQYAVYAGSGPATGFTKVSNSPVFSDSISSDDIRSGNLPETQDQPVTDESWYLFLKNANAVDYTTPLKVDSSGNLEQYTPANFNNLLQYHMRYAIVSLAGSQIRYQVEDANGTQGRTSGQGMTDTHYASFSRRTQQVGDTYTTQEVPAGTITTRNTYYLKIVNSGDVSGTDTTETYTVTSSPTGSVAEGQSVTFTINSNNVENGRAISYSITGIQAADISAGSLTGSVTIQNSSASTTITLANDTSSEGETATCSFSTSVGTKSIAVDITDIIQEQASLEGTVSQPEIGGFTPIPGSNGMEIGWRFKKDGRIAYIDNRDGNFTEVFTGHDPWMNISNPTGDWYVRCTSRTGDGTIQGGWSLNTWYKISGTSSADRTFMIKDLRTPGTYGGPMETTYTFQISPDQSTIAATGYYKMLWEGGA